MKTYEIAWPGDNGEICIERMTEEQILNDYWDYWSKRMKEVVGENSPEITKERCIEDWVIGNWAIEVKECPKASDQEGSIY